MIDYDIHRTSSDLTSTTMHCTMDGMMDDAFSYNIIRTYSMAKDARST